ncbi:MAG: type II secretion system secretin GspD [Burkholderiaceae bacterium]|jgi:general secretion pathway protein D|nr:type II secretion system secretin GspD [Burkholderiaceae bacterium]
MPKFARWAIAMLLAADAIAGMPAWAAGDKSAAAPAQPPGPVSSKAAKAGATVTLDFANAEIDAVARTMATITGRNVVVDPRVKGTMTLESTNPVTPDEALRLFSAQLRAQGYALVDSEGIYVVLPEADAKLQAAGVSAGPARAIKGGGQIQTQIFHLTHENASNLVPVLRPLISPNNTINVDAGSNALIVTDYGDNLQRIARIIAALDVSNATGVEVVRLHYAVASDLAPLVAKLLEPGGSATPAANAAPNAPQPGQSGNANAAAASVVAGGDGYRTTLIPEPRSNAIIVRAANPARLAMAKSLIEQLDQPADTHGSAGEDGNIHVVYLKNADATKLAVTLRAALAALPGQNNSQNAGAAAGGNNNAANTAATQPAPSTNTSANGSTSSSTGLNSGPAINAQANNQPSTGGQIQADPATNSLIISAPEPVYRELRAVIDKLDQRRAQVYVESLIAEINTDREADLGIQWQGLLGNGNTTFGAIGTNYSTSRATGGTTTNILNFASQFYGMKGNSDWLPSVSPNTGFNLIFGSRALGLLANFIQSTGAGNVLSTPTLLTLDNEEARIMVGQNVPLVTGSYTNTGASSTSMNPFQTYDRQDVGITLRVRPQISEDGSIKLVIYQEVSSVVANTVNNPAGPTTNKRAIESSVIVNDGQIVVLGGLLQDEVDTSEDKVPLLGDIPVVGNLFKSRNRSHTKTNLMVFLRPVIVRDAASAERYSLDRYDMMRAAQQGTQPEPSSVLNVGHTPVLPAVAPVNPQTASRPTPPAPLLRAAPGDAGQSAPPQSVTPAAGDRIGGSGAPLPPPAAPVNPETADHAAPPALGDAEQSAPPQSVTPTPGDRGDASSTPTEQTKP